MGTTKSNNGFISKILIAIAMMASIYGCGGGGSSHAPTTFTFNVTNSSSYIVQEFYLSPSSSTTWGPNQFSSPLAPGNTRSITGVPCNVGAYDFYAYSSSSGVTWPPAWDVTMPPCGGTYNLTLTN